MTLLSFTVDGPPVGKGRPRFTGRGHVYTPAKTAAWERKAATLARLEMGIRRPYEGPVELHVVAVHKRPGSRPEHVPLDVWRGGGRVAAITRIDVDNTVKACADALNHAGVWNDDNQIAHVEAWSFYAARNEAPHVEVSVSALTVAA